MEEKFLRPDEIAQRLDVKVETVRSWCRRGELPAYKIANDWRITQADFRSFLLKRRNTREEN